MDYTEKLNKIKDKLLEYQVPHTENLIRVISKNNCALDASDTGVGKTYSSIALCHVMSLRPVIICPKSVISVWKKVCKHFDVVPFFIVNYETFRLGKYYEEDNRKICPFINITEKGTTEKDKKTHIEFKLPNNVIMIFDEVHRCSNSNSMTQNSQLLYFAKLSGTPLLLLSATIADDFEKFRLFFWVLNFIDTEFVEKNKLTFRQYNILITKWLERDRNPMLRIHNMLFPNRGSRIRIDTLGDLFPQTQIIAEPYSLGNTKEREIEEQYSIIEGELEKLKTKQNKDKSNPLVIILRAQQKIELLKIPIIIELANDFIDAKYSVVIFVNFTQTLVAIGKLLKCDTFIYGEQTQMDRDNAIQDFQDNRVNRIICNIKAGSVGLSLHDIHGGHPRASIISPPWSSTDLVQSLGRIHRAGGMSKSLQRIIYVANTIEEKIAEKLKKKLAELNTINNGDLDLSGLSNSIKFKK